MCSNRSCKSKSVQAVKCLLNGWTKSPSRLVSRAFTTSSPSLTARLIFEGYKSKHTRRAGPEAPVQGPPPAPSASGSRPSRARRARSGHLASPGLRRCGAPPTRGSWPGRAATARMPAARRGRSSGAGSAPRCGRAPTRRGRPRTGAAAAGAGTGA